MITDTGDWRWSIPYAGDPQDAGMMQQLGGDGNRAVYSRVDLTVVRQALEEIFSQTTAPVDRPITIYTGRAGMRELNRALRENYEIVNKRQRRKAGNRFAVLPI